MRSKFKLTKDEEKVIENAIAILESKYNETNPDDSVAIHYPSSAVDFLKLKYGHLDREIFGAIFLNQKNNIISVETFFLGGVSQVAVEKRIILKRVLEKNATQVILFHNHPSGGLVDFGINDHEITHEIKKALKLIDVTVLDHIVVTESDYYSFAENNI